jgi:TetR/AcrR family transcriptional regulator, mexJK operon transcriptional repressor
MAHTAKRERCTADVRRNAIIAAATDVFLERGYAAASVDAVVERAGGSKATVYAMFGNKTGLLEAVITGGCQLFTALAEATRASGPIEDVLRRIARAYLAVMFEPKRLALFRLVVGESHRHPEIGDIFFRNAPRSGTRMVADFLRERAARGEIVTEDAERLANYFLSTLRGDLFQRTLYNPTRAPTKQEIEEHIDFVLAMFLRSCRPAQNAA